jgi:hypothetical protein
MALYLKAAIGEGCCSWRATQSSDFDTNMIENQNKTPVQSSPKELGKRYKNLCRALLAGIRANGHMFIHLPKRLFTAFSGLE